MTQNADDDLTAAQNYLSKSTTNLNCMKELKIFDKKFSLLHLTNYSELQLNGLEVLSDQPLSSQDLEFNRHR